jgi:hypothetical protein
MRVARCNLDFGRDLLWVALTVVRLHEVIIAQSVPEYMLNQRDRYAMVYQLIRIRF